MRYRGVGKSKLQVSAIGFSMAPLGAGGWRNQSETDLVRLLSTAFDCGIHLFETGDTFGNGASEELLARALSKERDDLIIATRVGFDIYHYTPQLQPRRGPIQNFSPQFIRYAVEKSLKRLRTDRIDLVQLHHIRGEQIEAGELWETLASLRQEGKLLHCGAVLAPGSGSVREGVGCIQSRQVTALQHSYNVFDQTPGKALHSAVYHEFPDPEAPLEELPPFYHGAMAEEPRFQTGFLISDPIPPDFLRQGKGSPVPVRAQSSPGWVEAMQQLTGKETGRTASQAALLWLLSEPAIASCFPPMLDEKALAEFVESLAKPLSAEEKHRLDALARA